MGDIVSKCRHAIRVVRMQIKSSIISAAKISQVVMVNKIFPSGGRHS